MADLPSRVLFGAAYYHEYQPYERLEADLDLMAEARFTVIRVGESVWSTWEPENGRFELDWLRPVLDGAHERGLAVVLGTPTYAVPLWLARQYPEIAGTDASGSPSGWGARQEVDYTHPAFRFHAERVIRAVTARYARHPAVIGFQVDNEPGTRIHHNHGVFQRFVDDLRQRYGDVETLNREWGLVYWSHRLSTWADLWTPKGNAQPQYDLAWRAFEARQTSEFIAWQAAIVREYASPEQFVTTCLAYGAPGLDDDELTDSLDVTAGNPYYDMQDSLTMPEPPAEKLPQQWMAHGAWALHQSADRIYSSRQEPFLITETNAQAIGGSSDNRPAFDGQWRQAAWALVARGARMIEYWHWHTLHFGTETYWGGVLPHSGRPGRVHRELAVLGAEFERAGELVAGITPDADIAMVYSAPSKWLMNAHPPLATADGGQDGGSYDGIFEPFYRGAFEAGRQVRILHARQLHDPSGARQGTDPESAARRHPVLIAAGLYVADDGTLDWLAAYARAGGHLVLGPRTGYGDQEARARHEVTPARLVEAAGVRYDEFSNLHADLPLITAPDSPLRLPAGAVATRWVECLAVDDAEVMATYDHPHFGRWPAITTRRHGAGRVTCVGTVPGRELARSLAAWAAPAPLSGWQGLPDSATAATGTAPDGRRVHVVHNWSWTPAAAHAPVDLTDVLNGSSLPAGARVELGPWDVRVFAAAPQPRTRTDG
ncbi:beta-galactosidase [Streptomyces sp. CBMA29]|uniref:beta-galactosidase n=1 Tax=Streptomyces sp. CBMA29 TaxID=1896314 RepID=UPI001661A44A|nr:beta-galactosidase [Streptomyces sp. CBMA29]MBD0734906.1 beta-galactosidase [Streptomyces sp. CBMA29]